MNILQLSLNLNLGGTEKTLQIFSKYLKRQGAKVTVAAFNSTGPRKNIILKEHIQVFNLNKNFNELKKLIEKRRIDIVHIHRSNKNALPIIKFLKERTSVKIVETNAFGKITKSPTENLVDLRIFVSIFCAYRFMKRYKIRISDFLKKNRIIYNPIDFDEVFNWKKKDILAYKKKIGIRATDFVIGKYGRKDYLKFGDICIEMFPYLIKKVPNIKYLIIGLPDNLKKKAIKLNVYSHIIELKTIIQPKELSRFIATLDILAHSSLIGESFGCVYSESMAHKKPIVTNSTPFLDNAQIEIVEDGVNGKIANTPQSFAASIEYLLKDKNSYLKIANNNFNKVKKFYEAKILTNELHNFYKELLSGHHKNKYLISEKDLKMYNDNYSKKAYELKPKALYHTLRYFTMKKIEGFRRKFLSINKINEK